MNAAATTTNEGDATTTEESSYASTPLLLLSVMDQLETTTTTTTSSASSNNKETKFRLILASQSPRRKEILNMMGLQGRFEATPSPLDESALQERLPKDNPVKYTQTLAQEKARALAETLEKQQQPVVLVLGSDTIVDLQGHILEKPVDEDDAKRTLMRLSGQGHCVHTGVAIYAVTGTGSGQDCQLVSSFVDTANVTFAKLSDADIEAYVATGEPMDKAGSYGIQGIGGQLVQSVEGDFFTVMGLPMHRVSQELAKAMAQLC